MHEAPRGARGHRVEAGRRATRWVGRVHEFRRGNDGEAGPAVAEEDADKCVGGARAPVHGEPDDSAGDGECHDAAQHG